MLQPKGDDLLIMNWSYAEKTLFFETSVKGVLIWTMMSQSILQNTNVDIWFEARNTMTLD